MQDELKPVAWMYGRANFRLTRNFDTRLSETPLYDHPPTTNPVAVSETPVGDHQMVGAVDCEAVTDADRALYRELERFVFQGYGGPGLDGECLDVIAAHRQASLTAARAQDRNEIEAWQVAAETWQQNFQDASCENQRLQVALGHYAADYDYERKCSQWDGGAIARQAIRAKGPGHE